MTEAQETQFWATIAQICAVLLLTLVLEVRRLSKRWSKKRFYKRRPARWFTAFLYFTVLFALVLTLVFSLLLLITESSQLLAVAAIALVAYSAASSPLFQPWSRWPQPLSTSSLFLMAPLTRAMLRSVQRTKAEQDAKRARMQRTERLRALMEYADLLIAKSAMHRHLDENPHDPDQKARVAIMDAALAHCEDRLTSPEPTSDPASRAFQTHDELSAFVDKSHPAHLQMRRAFNVGSLSPELTPFCHSAELETRAAWTTTSPV